MNCYGPNQGQTRTRPTSSRVWCHLVGLLQGRAAFVEGPAEEPASILILREEESNVETEMRRQREIVKRERETEIKREIERER